MHASSGFYRIGSEAAPTGARPLAAIEGQHRWMLPNRIGCPDCGVYGVISPAHPAVDLSTWPEATTLEEPSAASWRQFDELRARLASVVADAALVVPGAECGPFRGRVQGGPADLVLGGIHLLFATPETYARLKDAGCGLPPAVPATLIGRRRTPAAFWEVDVPSAGRLAATGYAARGVPCTVCGRWPRTLETPLLEIGSVPAEADLIRPRNHATLLFASERFVAAVQACELTGLTFEAVGGVEADA